MVQGTDLEQSVLFDPFIMISIVGERCRSEFDFRTHSITLEFEKSINNDFG